MNIEFNLDISKSSLSETEISSNNISSSTSTNQINASVPNKSSQQSDTDSLYSTVTNSPRCSCLNTDCSIESRALEEERYQWAVQEQMEWFRYNLDPYYPYYNQPEQLPIAPVEQVRIRKEEEELSENRNSVPSGILAILQMLRGDDEGDELCDSNNNNDNNNNGSDNNDIVNGNANV